MLPLHDEPDHAWNWGSNGMSALGTRYFETQNSLATKTGLSAGACRPADLKMKSSLKKCPPART